MVEKLSWNSVMLYCLFFFREDTTYMLMCNILTAVIWSNCLNLTEKWYSHYPLGFITFHERASGIKVAPCHTPHYTTHTHAHTHMTWPTYCTGHSLFVMAGSKLWSSKSTHDLAVRLVSFIKNHNCALPETLTREHHKLLHCTHTQNILGVRHRR